jgi:hypothetical protein
MPGDETRRRALKAGGAPNPGANPGTNPGAKPRVKVSVKTGRYITDVQGEEERNQLIAEIQSNNQ